MPTKITQQELANQVGASRDMISRILKELTLAQDIRIEDRRITLLRDPPDRW